MAVSKQHKKELKELRRFELVQIAFNQVLDEVCIACWPAAEIAEKSIACADAVLAAMDKKPEAENGNAK